jgi:Rad3-related DNA helicase
MPSSWLLADLHSALQQHFGHASFRAGQEDLVRAVVDGYDVLAVMPTGSGKSLGFQLPAILLPGTTLVVSPLISLMKDQVDELNRRGIRRCAVAFDALRRRPPSDAHGRRVAVTVRLLMSRRNGLPRSISPNVSDVPGRAVRDRRSPLRVGMGARFQTGLPSS